MSIIMEDTVWVKSVSELPLRPVSGIEGRWLRLVSADAGNGGMIFGVGELLPHTIMGWHEHPEPEIFFVMEGRGEARWTENGEERARELCPGAAFYKVGGVPHTMVNTGESPLRGVFFKIDRSAA